MTAQTRTAAGQRQIIKTKRRTSSAAPSSCQVDVVHMAESAARHRAARRHANVAAAAYFLAEKRDFAAGREIEDWLQAELQVEAAERALLCPTDEITPAEVACQTQG